ncbi:MAG: polysaccharide deacetylase family protein [Moorellales bacterium]
MTGNKKEPGREITPTRRGGNTRIRALAALLLVLFVALPLPFPLLALEPGERETRPILLPATLPPTPPASLPRPAPAPVPVEGEAEFTLATFSAGEAPGPLFFGLAQAAENQVAAELPAAALPPVREVITDEKLVALTFDDGPHPLTEAYLEALAQAGARATFFLVAARARRYPELARRLALAGHEVANHSLYHGRLGNQTEESVRAELVEANQLLKEITGWVPVLFRPPYGEKGDSLLRAAQAAGLTVVTWSVDPRDWEDPPPEVIVSRVLQHLRPGAIVILHEGHPHTLQALPLCLSALKQKGYVPVTVSELLARAGSRPAASGPSGS